MYGFRNVRIQGRRRCGGLTACQTSRTKKQQFGLAEMKRHEISEKWTTALSGQTWRETTVKCRRMVRLSCSIEEENAKER